MIFLFCSFSFLNGGFFFKKTVLYVFNFSKYYFDLSIIFFYVLYRWTLFLKIKTFTFRSCFLWRFDFCFCFKLYFLVFFKSFWYTDIKNKFWIIIIKYYFNACPTKNILKNIRYRTLKYLLLLFFFSIKKPNKKRNNGILKGQINTEGNILKSHWNELQ
jgi:hypothetical protein